jgi:hypothetical protein
MSVTTTTIAEAVTTAPQFNPDFFVAAVTVIPIFWLALVVETSSPIAGRWLLDFQVVWKYRRHFGYAACFTTATRIALAVVISAVVVWSMGEEVNGMLALAWHQQDRQTWVLVAACAMPISALLWKIVVLQDPGINPKVVEALVRAGMPESDEELIELGLIAGTTARTEENSNSAGPNGKLATYEHSPIADPGD